MNRIPFSAKKKLTIGCISPLSMAKDARHFFLCVEAMASLGHSWNVLATGDAQAQQQGFRMMEAFGSRFSLYESVPQNKKVILKKSDIAFFVTKPTMKDLSLLAENGIVPVCPFVDGLSNYDAQKESGNAFLFEEGSHWQIIHALIRAEQNFQFTYDWKQIVSNFDSFVFKKKSKKAKSLTV